MDNPVTVADCSIGQSSHSMAGFPNWPTIRPFSIIQFAVFVLLGSVIVGAQAPRRDVAPVKVGSGVVRGRVLSAVDKSPIRKARVGVSGGATERDPVYSDGEGRFEIGALPAGRYSVTAAKAGFATTTFGTTGFLDRPATVVVTDATVTDRIDLLMPRGAAIMGRVLDDLGDPVVGLNVTAGHIAKAGGRSRLVTALSVQTDDLGEYRLGGLAAGSYIVSVSSGPSASEGRFLFDGGVPAGSRVWARTYHPSTTSLAQAEPVSVEAGQEVPAVDFAMRPSAAPQLWLTASDAAGNAASGNFMVVSSSPFDTSNHSGSLQDGYASLGVEPGDWTLLVSGPRGIATTTFTASDDDVVVDLTLGKPARLSGTVVFEGAARPPLGEVVIECVIGGGVPVSMMRAESKMSGSGSFTITNLIGTRELRLRSGPPGWELTSLTLAGRSLLDGPVEFHAGEALTGAVAVMTQVDPP